MASFIYKIKKMLVKPWDFGNHKYQALQIEEKNIIDHIETYFGKTDYILTDDKHEVDIHIIKPTLERPCYTLYTIGMSSLPMKVPSGMEGYEFAELMLHLPFYWALDYRPENYWPIEWLKTLAMYPRRHNTWLFYGRLIKGRENGEAFAHNTGLSYFTLGATRMLPKDSDRDDFAVLDLSPEKTVYFFTVLPLYIDEAAYRQEHSAEELFDLFDKKNISDIIDIHRTRAVILQEQAQ